MAPHRRSTAVSKHLAMLAEAGLVVDRRAGRETRYRLNAAPLREIQDWVSVYERFWTDRLDRLKHLLEDEPHDQDQHQRQHGDREP